MCVNLSIFAKFTQTRSRKFHLQKLDLNRVILQESCGKFLQEILAGKYCWELLRENLAQNCCGKILQENVVGNSCWKFLRKNIMGKFLGWMLIGYL